MRRAVPAVNWKETDRNVTGPGSTILPLRRGEAPVGLEGILKRLPGENSHGVNAVGGPAHADQDAADPGSAGQDPEGLARQRLPAPAGRQERIDPGGDLLGSGLAPRRGPPAGLVQQSLKGRQV